MKILHICNSDGGGAGIAAFRLHLALRAEGIDSWMAVRDRKNEACKVVTLDSPAAKIARRVNGRSERRAKLGLKEASGVLWSVSDWRTFNVSTINRIGADLVHLHWINGGTLGIPDLRKIEAPLVWSLHDIWPLSNGAHYLGDDFDVGGEVEMRKVTIERRVQNAKEKYWADLNLTWIPLSTWMAEQVKSSAYSYSYPVEQIWNSVPQSIYKLGNQKEARKNLSLPLEIKIILFGAENAFEDRRKGSDLLVKALESLPRRQKDNPDTAMFLSFGGDGKERKLSNGYTIKDIGRIEGDDSLAALYQAADLFICPSREDNLPNTCVEAVSTGLPVVSFSVGGLSDIVVPGLSGCLVPPFSTELLSQAIQKFIEGELRYDRDEIFEFALNRFSPERQVKEITKVYSGALGRFKNRLEL
ncbi:glycosyltransferase [Roseibacillus persicicus]|uniref:glycosyltransferase n=1 Tax=Roseibacillus persicicus TaxID=454148 RepID=UPI00280C7603|nr:glycosyltransferase [Roseibacillus persicicus]MDQ8188857.1 glycosyltransferase [Roseibacillus persicicus]